MQTQRMLVLFLRSIIALLLTYLLSVGFAGGFKAWVLKKMGDDTPEDMGMLTIDPFAHIDPLGFLFLLLFGYGWGKRVPVDFDAFHGSWIKLKIAVATYADVIMHVLLAMASILIFPVIGLMSGTCTLSATGAYIEVITMLLNTFFTMNVFLATIRIITNTFSLVMAKLVGSGYIADDSIIFYLTLIGPFIFFYVYGIYVQRAFQYLIVLLCQILFWFLG